MKTVKDCAQRHSNVSGMGIYCSAVRVGRRIGIESTTPATFCVTVSRLSGMFVKLKSIVLNDTPKYRSRLSKTNRNGFLCVSVPVVGYCPECPKWGSPRVREWKVGNREIQSGCPEC